MAIAGSRHRTLFPRCLRDPLSIEIEMRTDIESVERGNQPAPL
jgi:hypothetical protein